MYTLVILYTLVYPVYPCLVVVSQSGNHRKSFTPELVQSFAAKPVVVGSQSYNHRKRFLYILFNHVYPSHTVYPVYPYLVYTKTVDTQPRPQGFSLKKFSPLPLPAFLLRPRTYRKGYITPFPS